MQPAVAAGLLYVGRDSNSVPPRAAQQLILNTAVPCLRRSSCHWEDGARSVSAAESVRRLLWPPNFSHYVRHDGDGDGDDGDGNGDGRHGNVRPQDSPRLRSLDNRAVDDCCSMLRLLPQDGDAWNGDDGWWYGCAYMPPWCGKKC